MERCSNRLRSYISDAICLCVHAGSTGRMVSLWRIYGDNVEPSIIMPRRHGVKAYSVIHECGNAPTPLRAGAGRRSARKSGPRWRPPTRRGCPATKGPTTYRLIHSLQVPWKCSRNRRSGHHGAAARRGCPPPRSGRRPARRRDRRGVRSASDAPPSPPSGPPWAGDVPRAK
jgi:hypothetical protein